MIEKDQIKDFVEDVKEDVKEDVESAKKIRISPKKVVIGIGVVAGTAFGTYLAWKFRPVAAMAAAAAADVAPEVIETAAEVAPEVAGTVL